MGSYIYFISVSKDIASSRLSSHFKYCGMHFLDRKQLNRHKVDAKHINFKKKKADGDEDNNEVEAVAE